MNFTPEQITKAKAAKSAEELFALAKENGMEMTDDEAKKYFADLHKEGELSDDELDNVSGGCGGDPHTEHLAFSPAFISHRSEDCPVCGCLMDYVEYVTSKSGYSSYSVYYCPKGEVYFDREMIPEGYTWGLDKERNG